MTRAPEYNDFRRIDNDTEGKQARRDVNDGDGGYNYAKDKATNDKLYGGAGNDVFVFDGGKDVIYNYASNDRIVCDDGFDGVKIKGYDVVLQAGKNKLTIEEGVGRNISITDGDGVTSTYSFSKTNKTFESALLETSEQLPTGDRWLDDGDSSDALSEIVTPKAVGAVSSNGAEKIFSVGAKNNFSLNEMSEQFQASGRKNAINGMM